MPSSPCQGAYYYGTTFHWGSVIRFLLILFPNSRATSASCNPKWHTPCTEPHFHHSAPPNTHSHYTPCWFARRSCPNCHYNIEPKYINVSLSVYRRILHHTQGRKKKKRTATRPERGSKDILKSEIPILLHFKTLDVAALLGRVLKAQLSAPVDGDFAVALHLELDGLVAAPEAVSGVEPFAGSETAVLHDCDWGGEGSML